MRIIFAILFAIAAYMSYPEGVGDIPFAQLTLAKLVGFVVAILNGSLAVWILFKGFE